MAKMYLALIALSVGCCMAAESEDIDRAFDAKGSPPPSSPPPFGFSPVLGSNMVLQQAPAMAAVYGFLGNGSAVSVTVSSTTSDESYTVQATVNSTTRPIGYNAATSKTGSEPFPIFSTWKALLHPTPAGGDYTITATCTGCTTNGTVTIVNVTFGDMWYCSGQSNMWLPVHYSFSRNDSVAQIQAGNLTNIRGIFAPSANTPSSGSMWMSTTQAISTGAPDKYPLFDMGAACWYFAQKLAQSGVSWPIGIADTAIGGQRIEEFLVNDSTIEQCQNRSGETTPRSVWDGQLWAKQVMPFVDMTVKGWAWYQGENNMGAPKGNSIAGIGYSCEQKLLVEGWRKAWSKVAGTTDPMAPFGVVTLASSGAEGADAAMGAMRIAQTAGYGVLPNPGMPNTFLAQAYDLDDPWGPAAGPCFSEWECCTSGGQPYHPPPPPPPGPGPPYGPVGCYPDSWLKDIAWKTGPGLGGYPAASAQECCAMCTNATMQKLHCKGWSFTPAGGTGASSMCWLKNAEGGKVVGNKGGMSGGVQQHKPAPPPSPPAPPKCTAEYAAKCTNACAAAADTPFAMGGIHPRSKKPVGDRLGQAAYNLVYGGKGAMTGPTLSGCSFENGKLTVSFNTSLLAGDKVVLQKYGKGQPNRYGMVGGSYFDVQTNADNFCMEAETDRTTGQRYCPLWAGGNGKPTNATLDGGWISGLDIALGSDASSITVDLSPLNGTAPTAIRYAWSIVNCCDLSDPDLYVTKPCYTGGCPIMSSSNLPANPFLAKIVDGKCACIPPQQC